MTVIARPRNNYGFLFGSGADGDVTISANTNLTSTLNGGIVYKNYMNLTINSGCTLSVSNMCQGLWIRVRGTLTLNGAISMSNKGCYIAGGGDDLYLCYNDILVPKVGAAGGAAVNSSYGVGNPGSAGTDGKCGGGGAGGTSKDISGYRGKGGNGAAGGIFGGGCGAGGGAIASLENNNRYDGEAGQAYGLRGGNGAHAQDYYSPDFVNGEGGGGAGGVTGGLKGGGNATAGSIGSGGILVVMANKIVGSGQLLAKGANGGIGQAGGSEGRSSFGAGGGGGSGGGSITLFYYSIVSGTLVFNASGGLGGAGSSGGAGGAGGAGSCRDYSLAELASHTRVQGEFMNGSPIYGVSWDGAESPTLTRTDSSIGMTANAGVDMGAVTNDFDGADIFKDITEVTDDLGNVFVRIPKFYIEKTAVGNARTWRISKGQFGNAYLPYCFRNKSGAILPYVDVGKYNAGLSSGSALTSASGVYPLISKNIVDFRNYAKANGANYHQLDIHIVDLLQTLFIIEFATLDSQSIMSGWTGGRYGATDLAMLTENNVNKIALPNATAALYAVGQPISIGSTQGGNEVFYGRNITSIGVNDDAGAGNRYITFDGDPVNIATGNYLYNSGWKSGFSSGILAKSGSIGSNSTGKFPCAYRGIENPWGSIYEFVDGVNVNDNQAWVSKYQEDYASNLFANPYEQLSYVSASASNNYIVQVGYDSNLPFANFPTNVTSGNYNKYYADYYYQATGQRIARVGGDWRGGHGAGLFLWSLGSASSDAFVNIGGRLCRKAGG